MSSIRYLFTEGIKNIFTNRLMAFASFGVLVCCLLMMGCSLLFVLNVNEAFESVEEQNVMQVYIKDGVDQETIDDLMIRFSEMDNISKCEYVSKEEAFDSFLNSNEDYSDIFGGLAYDNPLPASFKLTVEDLTQYQNTYDAVSAVNEVKSVRGQYDVAQKLLGIRQLIAIISFWIVGLLAFVSLFIISNTIRITMHGRRLEISIMKSVGATDGFVTVPFVVEGMMLGLLSSIASFFAIWYIYNSADGVMLDTLGTPIIPFTEIWLPIIIIFLVVGLLAGGLGSGISIRKYLKSGGGSVYDAI